MEFLAAAGAWLVNHLALIFGIPVVGLGLGFILKKYLSAQAEEAFGAVVEKVVFAVFVAITIGLNKVTGGIWNKAIEPYAKVFLSILLNRALQGALKGLDSDNNGSKYGRNGN